MADDKHTTPFDYARMFHTYQIAVIEAWSQLDTFIKVSQGDNTLTVKDAIETMKAAKMRLRDALDTVDRGGPF